jgi:hypothetical protein
MIYQLQSVPDFRSGPSCTTADGAILRAQSRDEARLRNFNGQCLKLGGKDMELDDIERCDGKFEAHNKLVVKTNRRPIIRRIWTVLVVTTGIRNRQTKNEVGDSLLLQPAP